MPSAGRAGSGFPRMDRRVAQWGPRNTSHTAQPGRRGRSVIRGRVRCRSHFVAWERRRRELESKPVIDTARSTAGEGHVVRYGDVRRVRKVYVGCPASRTLRGQPPAHNSSRYVRRTETVRNRLTRKPTTKPLPPKTAEAQTQEPRNRKNKKRGQSPQLNASTTPNQNQHPKQHNNKIPKIHPIPKIPVQTTNQLESRIWIMG